MTTILGYRVNGRFIPLAEGSQEQMESLMYKVPEIDGYPAELKTAEEVFGK